MLPIHRQQTLLEWLKEEGALKISDISERFGVSEMTVYRDVNQLADANRIIRTPGGITLPPASERSANQCGYCLRPIQHSYSNTNAESAAGNSRIDWRFVLKREGA